MRRLRSLSAQSAGLVVYRKRDGRLEVLLVHPGGPFWAKRDDGAWSIPKGELAENEAGIDVARREFQEELGVPAPDGELKTLGAVRQAGGKVVHAWAASGDVDVTRLTSNTFEIEWPPRSGKRKEFSEIDRAEFLPEEIARRKINPAQTPFLDRLRAALQGPAAS